ncbi:hypothetical protein BKA62DRAFT_777885 [Auriculariales sp. MPI-PUGE-AT-0066]|nr:hypothetical protein BKA62DRAFT_777885 [Auriculariales sp. MPI-PUGE-AT-0066]
MFAANEKWRKEYGADKLYADGFEFPRRKRWTSITRSSTTRRTRRADLSTIEQLGKLDVGALYKITTQERQLKRLVWEYEKFLRERVPACSAAAGHPVETSCTILDLKNVGMGQFWKVKDYIAAASNIGRITTRRRWASSTLSTHRISSRPCGPSPRAGSIRHRRQDRYPCSDYKAKLLENIDPESLPAELNGGHLQVHAEL